MLTDIENDLSINLHQLSIALLLQLLAVQRSS